MPAIRRRHHDNWHYDN